MQQLVILPVSPSTPTAARAPLLLLHLEEESTVRGNELVMMVVRYWWGGQRRAGISSNLEALEGILAARRLVLHHGADGAPHHAGGRTEVVGALGGIGVLALPENRHEQELVADEAVACAGTISNPQQFLKGESMLCVYGGGANDTGSWVFSGRTSKCTRGIRFVSFEAKPPHTRE